MEQIAEQITQDLLQELPDHAQFFTLNELLSFGIPNIVIETLRKSVESTIDSELSMPESDWFQYDHEKVAMAWQDFVEISREQLQIPASKLSYLLAEAVEQCLELALKPRQAVAEIIFRTHDTIDLSTAKDRVFSLEVNKQLGLALLRYMEKKGKPEITFDQAHDLIQKVDRRLVENYHPLNWAQALKPVFELAGPSVNSTLFRIFFEDKEKTTYARKFDLLDEKLNETEFIEFLSSANMLDIDEYEDDQSELFVPVQENADKEEIIQIDETDDEEKMIASNEEIKDFSEEQTDEETDFADMVEPEDDSEDTQEPTYLDAQQEIASEESSDEEDYDDSQENERDENIVNLFSQITNEELFEDDDKEQQILSLVEDDDDNESDNDNITLLSKFIFDESMEDPSENFEQDADVLETSDQKEPSSIYKEMNLVKDDGTKSQKTERFFDEEEKVEDEDEHEEELSFKIETPEENSTESEESTFIEPDDVVEGSEEKDDDQPMWRSFLERGDLDTESGYVYEEETEEKEVEDDGFIEGPIYDLTAEEEDPEEKISKISGWLDDEKARFVEEIFMGSEMAYEQALIEILDFENWKQASIYLEREVFSRNKVDVYDEAAVDFTDRLHSYFLENNSKQDE